jgi:Predicted pPIWI-associating nuclease
MTVAVRIQSKGKNVWFEELPDELAEAAREYQLSETSVWNELAELSNQTTFDGMEAYGDSAIVENGNNIAPGRVHVKLSFIDNDDENLEFTESFPARIFFNVNVDKKSVEIEKVEVDTAGFFED